MKRLTYYVARQQLQGVTLALLAACAFDSVFDLISEVDKIDGSYTLLNVLQYVGLYMPYRVNEFMPAAVLVGTIVSLGALSANLEMVALRAAGYSKLAILMPALGLAAVLALMVAANAQWLIPRALHAAEVMHEKDKDGSITKAMERLTGRLWLRDNDLFITAVSGEADGYRDAFVYETSVQGYLKRIIHAETMTSIGDTLILENVRQNVIGDGFIRSATTSSLAIRRSSIPIETLLNDPDAEKMNAGELLEYIRFARASRLNSAPYELALWRHLGNPVSILVLLLLAMPFVFTSTREGGTGVRLFLGIMLGLVCFILDRALSSFILIRQMPPWLAVFLPLMILLGIGSWRLYRCR